MSEDTFGGLFGKRPIRKEAFFLSPGLADLVLGVLYRGSYRDHGSTGRDAIGARTCAAPYGASLSRETVVLGRRQKRAPGRGRTFLKCFPVPSDQWRLPGSWRLGLLGACRPPEWRLDLGNFRRCHSRCQSGSQNGQKVRGKRSMTHKFLHGYPEFCTSEFSLPMQLRN